MNVPNRFSWNQMRDYWVEHDQLWSDVDFARDPGGLNNVAIAGAPLWRNRYHARLQQAAFARLFARVPPAGPSARALDVGCGAARWAQLLARRGYAVTGIDLQPKLLDANSRRYPNIRFVLGSIQEFEDNLGFDLITSVTVLQHMPFEEQDRAIRKLRTLVLTGGHVLILESVRAQMAHVFGNTVAEWTQRFRTWGFERVATQYYDYDPLGHLILKTPLQPRPDKDVMDAPRKLNAWERTSSRDRSLLRRVYLLQTALGMLMDYPVELLASRMNVTVWSNHCGLLFRAL